MSTSFDVVLRKQPDGRWTTDALKLPTNRVVSVSGGKGTDVPFERQEGAIAVGKRPMSTLIARIELSEKLAQASALDAARLDFEREKAARDDRQARRTLVVGVITALVTAGTTLGVAAITNFASKPDKPPQGNAYKDLNECRDKLNELKTLAALDQQSLVTLRAAVGGHADDCIKRLSAAMAASPP